MYAHPVAVSLLRSGFNAWPCKEHPWGPRSLHPAVWRIAAYCSVCMLANITGSVQAAPAHTYGSLLTNSSAHTAENEQIPSGNRNGKMPFHTYVGVLNAVMLSLSNPSPSFPLTGTCERAHRSCLKIMQPYSILKHWTTNQTFSRNRLLLLQTKCQAKNALSLSPRIGCLLILTREIKIFLDSPGWHTWSHVILLMENTVGYSHLQPGDILPYDRGVSDLGLQVIILQEEQYVLEVSELLSTFTSPLRVHSRCFHH